VNGRDDADAVMQAVTARLPSGVAVRVETAGNSADGMESVGLRDYDLSTALDSVGEIGSLVVEKVKAARPSKTASLTVTLEWSGAAGAATDGSGSAAVSGVAGG
jgi:hypothetical protein